MTGYSGRGARLVRGWSIAGLEPWTGHPIQLDQAVAGGAARMLGPGETQEATVSFVVYGDRASVTRVAPDGEGFAVS